MITCKVKTLQAGYKTEKQELVDCGIKVGDEFVVENISVGRCSSTVNFKINKGDYFTHNITTNSVFFDFYEDGLLLDIYSDKRFNKYIFKYVEVYND